jgi:thiamine monophosphate synthase
VRCKHVHVAYRTNTLHVHVENACSNRLVPVLYNKQLDLVLAVAAYGYHVLNVPGALHDERGCVLRSLDVVDAKSVRHWAEG